MCLVPVQPHAHFERLQFLVVRGSGNGSVVAGELTAVFLIPLPDGRRGVGGVEPTGAPVQIGFEGR